jgi:hypothetical protein
MLRRRGLLDYYGPNAYADVVLPREEEVLSHRHPVTGPPVPTPAPPKRPLSPAPELSEPDASADISTPPGSPRPAKKQAVSSDEAEDSAPAPASPVKPKGAIKTKGAPAPAPVPKSKAKAASAKGKGKGKPARRAKQQTPPPEEEEEGEASAEDAMSDA